MGASALAAPREMLVAAGLAMLLTCWAMLNGTGAWLDPRAYPSLVRRYLSSHFGGVARGKGLLMKYHRTVGAMAFAATSAAACVALALSGAPARTIVVGGAALAAAAASLMPSLVRGRFPLPRLSVNR